MKNLMKTLNKKHATALSSNLVVIFLLIYFYVVAVDLRFIAGDEGYFAYAGKAVLQGQTPYKDFFFPQAFLYPYFLAAWSYVLGESWQILRLFSALVAALIGYLIFDIIRVKRNILSGLLGVLLYISSDLVIAYFSIIKNYSLAILFLLLALRVYESKLKYKYFLIGFFLSIAFQIRSYVVLCEFIFLAFLYFDNRNKLDNKLDNELDNELDKKEFTRLVKLLLLGNLVGFIPTLYVMIVHFNEFIFNNLTYHALRNRAGLISGFHQKIKKFYSFFSGVENTGDISLQFALLFFLMCLKKIDFKSIYLYLIILLFLVSFLPTPVFAQYFVVVIPFLIIYICINEKNFLNMQVYKFLFSLVLAFYLINSVVEFQRYTLTGINVSGIYTRKEPTLWRPKNLDEQIKNVASYVYLEDGKRKGNEKLLIFSSWPGYLIGMDVLSLQGLENHFARNIAHKLTKEEIERYKIFYSNEDLSKLIESRTLRYLILGYRDKWDNLQRLAKESGYKVSNYKVVKLLTRTSF